MFKNFIKQNNSTRDFLSIREKSYTVYVRYKDGTVKKHENIKNPFMYKKKAIKDLNVEDAWFSPE